jgi:antitoxin component YwqK of YwqJK toxin-antitoxin module
MEKFCLLLFASLFVFGCRDNDQSERERSLTDSISKVQQRQRGDSLKKKNPLLIMPPDSNYTGSYVDKYPNGITKFTGFFRFGQRHGQWVSFYPNGLPWSELHYDKGIRHGPNVTYFVNGKKRFEGMYRNDKQDSVWIYYDTTGRVAERVLFKNSRIIRRLTGMDSTVKKTSR